MSNLVVSSHLRTSKPMRPQNRFPKDTASLQTKFKGQCQRTVAYWTPCLQFYTSLKCLSDRVCLLSSMENNISSTKHTVTYQLLQSFSSGVVTRIYSVPSLRQLCPIPLTENMNRAAIHICAQLQKKVKWSLLQNVSMWCTRRICVTSKWLQKRLWKYQIKWTATTCQY